MLRGQAILNPPKTADGHPDKGKLWPMPDPELLRKAFASYEKDAFAGHADTRNALYQASVQIYAAKSADEGDGSGVLNSSRWDESMRLATGGIEKYRGKAIQLPYGQSYSAFTDELGKRIGFILESGRLSDAARMKISDLPLEAVGDGRYVFRAGDGVLVYNDDRRPIVVDFNESMPHRFSGQPPADVVPTAAELEAAQKPVTGRALAKKVQPK